jgi:hypothetical protein
MIFEQLEGFPAHSWNAQLKLSSASITCHCKYQELYNHCLTVPLPSILLITELESCMFSI